VSSKDSTKRKSAREIPEEKKDRRRNMQTGSIRSFMEKDSSSQQKHAIIMPNQVPGSFWKFNSYYKRVEPGTGNHGDNDKQEYPNIVICQVLHE
jgi:hypothetical protein